MKMQALIESRIRDIQERKKALVNTWMPYIEAVNEYRQKEGLSEVSAYDAEQVAQCLENAFEDVAIRQKSKIHETTYQSNIAFLGVQLPVIAALLPSLVLNKIGVVQALDRRQGAVFYMDVKIGQNKGSLSVGDTLIGAKTGHATSEAARKYATPNVFGENIAVAGVPSASGTLNYKPLTAGTVIITDGVETFTDNGLNGLVSDLSGGSTGTIDYTLGTYSVTFLSGSAAATVTARYEYDYERAENGVPQLDINVTSSLVTAKNFPLRALYTLGSAIDLEKAHNINLEDEVVKFLGGEIKFEMDHWGIDEIYTAAISVDGADPIGTFSAAFSGGQEWIWHKRYFADYLEKGSNNIFAKTQRGFGNFLICGNNAKRLVAQQEGNFKPAPGYNKVTPTGPYEMGTLDGRLVIHDPYLPTNRYIMGYKGDNYLMTGFIFAPYIPLFSTPTIHLSDLKAQKGFLAAAGYKVTNAGLYTYGDVGGLG